MKSAKIPGGGCFGGVGTGGGWLGGGSGGGSSSPSSCCYPHAAAPPPHPHAAGPPPHPHAAGPPPHPPPHPLLPSPRPSLPTAKDDSNRQHHRPSTAGCMSQTVGRFDKCQMTLVDAFKGTKPIVDDPASWSQPSASWASCHGWCT